MMEIPGIGQEVTARSTASRKYPMQFLCDYANAVVDGETGAELEYRHLIKNPKHWDQWQRSFSKEIWRLATTTETIDFIRKEDIPMERKRDKTYARICVNERPEKADPDQT